MMVLAAWERELLESVAAMEPRTVADMVRACDVVRGMRIHNGMDPHMVVLRVYVRPQVVDDREDLEPEGDVVEILYRVGERTYRDRWEAEVRMPVVAPLLSVLHV